MDSPRRQPRPRRTCPRHAGRRRGARWSPGRTFPDTGRSGPSLLPVLGEEAVSVAKLPPDGPVYRNDRRRALMTSGHNDGPALRGKPSRVQGTQHRAEGRSVELVWRIAEDEVV